MILGYMNKIATHEQAASLEQSLPPLLRFLFDFPQWWMMTQDPKEADDRRARVSSLFIAHQEARILIIDH